MMKVFTKKLLAKLACLVLVITMCFSTAVLLSSCGSSDNDTQPVDGTTESDYTAVDIQDGVTLHCWNWSYTTIKNNLKKIADAGFNAVQTSPVQPFKDSINAGGAVSDWWKLYQPTGFQIADGWLGDKADLTSLCTAADNYGIKVIVDVVANHMANGAPSYNASTLHSSIETNEPTIFADYSTYFHIPAGGTSDSSIDGVVRRNLNGDLPDLDTSNEYVQGRVLALLKECIDCGVDGFRFDAAKHIETPDDGVYASDFWPTILDGAKAYATSKNLEAPYYYGEILNSCGVGRSYTSYTEYMSVTDNKFSDKVTAAVIDGRTGIAASKDYTYTSITANKAVLWAESHDTYMGESGSSTYKSTKTLTTADLNKAWAIMASRADAMSLYFARPSVNELATIGSVGNSSFARDEEISEPNKFHKKFIGAKEQLSYQGAVVINQRYFEDNSNSGAVIVSTSQVTTVNSAPCAKLPDGTYTDKISGNVFTVAEGRISGELGDGGVAVLIQK